MRVLVIALFACILGAQPYWELVDFETQNVQCIAQHPQDTDIMLISIADSIYRSSDSGDSWTFVAHFWGLPVNCLTLWFGDTAYALVGMGSYKVMGNTSSLEPLDRSGVYFVIASNGKGYRKNKLVVIDLHFLVHSFRDREVYISCRA